MFRLITLVFLCVSVSFSSFGQQKKRIKIVNSHLKHAPYLKKGDTVMIVAPAGILKDSTSLDDGIELFKDWGLHVKLGKYVFNQNGHFAGTDDERAEDFQAALNDPTVKAIWCGRGGYGSVRILDKIDFTGFKEQPKWLIGFSDITAFHSQIHTLGRETIHATMPITVDLEEKERKKADKTLKRALFGKSLSYKTPKNDFNRRGKAKGQIIGGNLALLASMAGSKSAMFTGGKIIFIEEVGEYIYSMDRMLYTLKRSGFFDNCAGIIVGGISNVRDKNDDFGKPIEQVFLDILDYNDIPVVFDFPAGHIKDNRALILGREIEFEVKKNKKGSIKFRN